MAAAGRMGACEQGWLRKKTGSGWDKTTWKVEKAEQDMVFGEAGACVGTVELESTNLGS